MNEAIVELINRRRQQILIHSYIYYRLNSNIISDMLYDNWCSELARLQKEYPNESKSVKYYSEFKDFDGSTGFDLPYHTSDIASRAESLYKYHKK